MQTAARGCRRTNPGDFKVPLFNTWAFQVQQLPFYCQYYIHINANTLHYERERKRKWRKKKFLFYFSTLYKKRLLQN